MACFPVYLSPHGQRRRLNYASRCAAETLPGSVGGLLNALVVLHATQLQQTSEKKPVIRSKLLWSRTEGLQESAEQDSLLHFLLCGKENKRGIREKQFANRIYIN